MKGELELRAAHDAKGKPRIGNDDATSVTYTYVRDSFSIKLELDSLDQNGWPRADEIGNRQHRIARRERSRIRVQEDPPGN